MSNQKTSPVKVIYEPPPKVLVRVYGEIQIPYSKVMSRAGFDCESPGDSSTSCDCTCDCDCNCSCECAAS